jgi:hypothetical protein
MRVVWRVRVEKVLTWRAAVNEESQAASPINGESRVASRITSEECICPGSVRGNDLQFRSSNQPESLAVRGGPSMPVNAHQRPSIITLR